MKFDLGRISFELTGPEAVFPAVFSAVSTADTAEAIAAGPTLAKNKPVTQRRTFNVALSFPKDGEAKEKAIERTMAEVVKRCQGKVRKEEPRTSATGPARWAEVSHKQGQTALRSIVYITFADIMVVTAMHTGLDLKQNEEAMRAQIEAFAKTLAARPL